MEWTDDAIILGARRHGEAHAVLTVLSHTHGRHLGLVHGGGSRRVAPGLQPGNEVRIAWRARLADQLGAFSVDVTCDHASPLLDTPDALLALTSVCALAANALPEREPTPGLYEGFRVLLAAFETPEIWPAVLVRWELGLLEVMGFGLDLGKCAVTGSRDDLTHVSPRTGRAVCREAAAPYRDRLLILPPFLLSSQAGAPTRADIGHGLALTGHFLAHHVFGLKGEPLPEPRERLALRLTPATQSSAADTE